MTMMECVTFEMQVLFNSVAQGWVNTPLKFEDGICEIGRRYGDEVSAMVYLDLIDKMPPELQAKIRQLDDPENYPGG